MIVMAPITLPSTALHTAAPIERISRLSPPAAADCDAGTAASMSAGMAEYVHARPIPTTAASAATWPGPRGSSKPAA